MTMNQRVLILRLDGIGDFVLFTGVLPHIRKVFPDAHITLALNSEVAPLAEHCPHVDRILPIDPGRFRTDLGYAEEITGSVRNKFDIAINPVYTRRRVTDNIIARTRAERRIGFECHDNDGRLERRRKDQVLYTELLKTSQEWMFELDRYALLLNHFRVAPVDLKPQLWFQPREKSRVLELLRGKSLREREFAIFCPGAGFSTKLWSAQAFAQTADEISRRFHLMPVLIGSKADHEIVESIVVRMNERSVTWIGDLNLREFAAVTEMAGLYVGLDTAGFHLAWTAGIPTVGIFGGGHFGRFNPGLPHVRIAYVPLDCYHCYWHCIYDEVKCLTAVTPEMVIGQVEDLLRPPEKGGAK